MNTELPEIQESIIQQDDIEEATITKEEVKQVSLNEL